MYLNLFIKSVFIENMALAFFLGMCSFLACSKKVETALGLGVAVVFVQVLTVPLNNLILKKLLAEGALSWISPSLANIDLGFLAFILFIGTIAAATQIVEMAVERYAPALYTTLGVFLPLIAVNCVILGGSLFMQSARLHVRPKRRLRRRLGAGLRDRHRRAGGDTREDGLLRRPPRTAGLGITFITAGLMSVAFMMFSGIQL